MKILLSSRGSRGDVHPVLQIAARLQGQGHGVHVCIPKTFAAAAAQRGLSSTFYDEDSAEVMRSFGAGWGAARAALAWFSRSIDRQLDILIERSAGADALVTSVNEVVATTAAQHRGIPHYRVAYAPMLPGDHPPPLLPYQRLPRVVNRAAWGLLGGSLRLLLGPQLNRRRGELGLEPLGSIARHLATESRTLLAFSPTLGPPSAGWDYPYSYTGYCFDEDPVQLDPAIARFLDQGPPPVYLGFGSVSLKDPDGFTRILLGALGRVGCRAIIGAGWSGLGRGSLPASVAVTGELPHEALFPRLAGVIHHGGSGTVHNAARFGLPQLVMPQIADQYYWGSRVHALGLGPAPLTPGRATVASMTARIRELVGNSSFGAQARALSLGLQAERGVDNAARIISGDAMLESGGVPLESGDATLEHGSRALSPGPHRLAGAAPVR